MITHVEFSNNMGKFGRPSKSDDIKVIKTVGGRCRIVEE